MGGAPAPGGNGAGAGVVPPPPPPLAARAPGEARPATLRLDKQGRLVDESGREIAMPSRRPDFMANAAAKEGDRKAGSEDGGGGGGVGGAAAIETSFFDPRLPEVEVKDRKKKAFHFHEQGTFVARASKQRAQAQLEKLQEEIERAAKKTGISAATKLALLAPMKSNTEDLTVRNSLRCLRPRTHPLGMLPSSTPTRSSTAAYEHAHAQLPRYSRLSTRPPATLFVACQPRAFTFTDTV
jgi:hypothetical protein